MVDNAVYSAMSGGKPYKTYKKVILGRVYVTVLNVSTGVPAPEGIILTGDPRKNEPSALYDVFSEQEDYFFRKMNQRHFTEGTIIEHQRSPEEARERTIEEYNDEELRKLISKPFLALQATLNKVSSVATVYRILGIAEEMDKSDKTIKAIKSRLSELQESPVMPDVVEQEL